MPKISTNNLGEYNKSCSAPHPESSKIEFTIFWIFYDCLGILQVLAKSVYYWSYTLHRDPYKELKYYNHALGLHLRPCKEKGLSNWVPGHGGGAARPILARPAALPAVQGRGEEGMLTKGPLVLGAWAGRHPTSAHGGDQRGRPRWPQLRRVRRTGWTRRDARSTKRSNGRRPSDLVARMSQN
jgi:hypothetical protein